MGMEINNLKKNLAINAFEQSYLQKWLRDVHKIYVYIELMDSNNDEIWYPVLINRNVRTYNEEDMRTYSEDLHYIYQHFDTYEDALEFILTEALELIE